MRPLIINNLRWRIFVVFIFFTPSHSRGASELQHETKASSPRRVQWLLVFLFGLLVRIEIFSNLCDVLLNDVEFPLVLQSFV